MAKAELTIEIRDLEEVKNELNAKEKRIAELEEQLKNATKQVRKKVCEEIREEVKKLIDKDFGLCNHEYANGYCYGLQYDLAKILDQIEKGEI